MTPDDGFEGFLTDLREFDNTRDSVLKMVWERRKQTLEQQQSEQQKQRHNSEARALQLDQNIEADLSGFLGILHNVNRPTLRKDLGIDICEDVLSSILTRIASQDMSEYVKKSGPVTGIPNHQVVHVYTRDAIIDMITEITNLVRARVVASPTLCLHLEGFNLHRNGKPQMMHVCFAEANKVWLICLAKLGSDAFTIKSPTSGQTLKGILESSKVRKAFWDCRSDIDALYSHFGIRMDPAALVDIKLLDLATVEESEGRKSLRDLESAVKNRLNCPCEQEKAWLKAKEEGFHFAAKGPNAAEKRAKEVEWADHLGRSMWSADAKARAEAAAKVKEAESFSDDGWRAEDAWVALPLPKVMEQYACGNVAVLPLLQRQFAMHERLTDKRKEAVLEEVKRRIKVSQAEHVEFTDSEAPRDWSAKDWCEEPRAQHIEDFVVV